MTPGAVAAAIRAGDRRALARAVTAVERGDDGGLADLIGWRGAAQVIGVTGPPGSGKSTLVAALVAAWRSAGLTVGVLAIDASSHRHGGALLGDRVRMSEHALDPGVFIRSMGTRGAHGGLAGATSAAARLLDAAGFDRVVIETVGTGQAEVAIAAEAHTTLVVTVPGLGDGVQALKTGILEIADLHVVAKADLPGADEAAAQLIGALRLGESPAEAVGAPLAEAAANAPFGVNEVKGDVADPYVVGGSWRPPVLKVSARTGEGLAELVNAIDAHAAWLRATGAWAEADRRRVTSELERRFRAEAEGRWRAHVARGGVAELAAAVLAGRIGVAGAAAELTRGEDGVRSSVGSSWVSEGEHHNAASR